MYRIGMQVDENTIQYTYVANQITIYDILNKYYRCPKKVNELIVNGGYYCINKTIKENICDDDERMFFLCYGNYKYFFRENYYAEHFLRCGTWFTRDSRGNITPLYKLC